LRNPDVSGSRRNIILPTFLAFAGILLGAALHLFDIKWRESHGYVPIDPNLNAAIIMAQVWASLFVIFAILLPRVSQVSFLLACVPLLGVVGYLVIMHLYVSPQIVPLLFLIAAADRIAK
jgi:hypothetical protein